MASDKKFKLCLTMAGAVSAGGYTAGVLDYLLESLELWQMAKDRNLGLGADHPDYDHTIPMHDVEIDVISGSSAGGISGTLTLMALADKGFTSYNKDNPSGENNILYKSWVEMADDQDSDTLEKLLGLQDLKQYGEVRSLLNTEAIEVIADKALTIKSPRPMPSYASKSLDIVLTTTNLRGLNFMVDFSGSGRSSSDGTVITNHGGFFRYKLTNESFPPGIPSNEDDLYYVLDFNNAKDIAYLRDATLSTAAFPIGLKSREVTISKQYIERYPKYLFGKAKGITPMIPEGDTYSFNSVDGGLINNEPYGIGLKILNEKNPDHFKDDKYAVIMVDPFPNKDHDVEKTGTSITKVAAGLFKALRNQVMFNQDGILEALALNDRTKFMIEPIRKVEVNGKWVRPPSDLAAAPISGFAGFLNREFREHDFQLGRKNCQTFLRYYFAVCHENIEGRLCEKATDQAKERFEFALPAKDPNGKKFFPIIPDMRVFKNFDEQVDKDRYGEDAKIKLVPFPKISFTEFEGKYKRLMKQRIGKLSRGLIRNQLVARLANLFFIKRKGYEFVKEVLYDSLRESDLLNDK